MAKLAASVRAWCLEMTITCPECGGESLRKLTPGFYECISAVDASIPPGLAGNPAWLHGSRPCGHRFQAGQAAVTEPCSCGRHSIGRCRDCERPLCGLHGTAEGVLLCRECFIARREREKTRENERKSEHASALQARASEISARIERCATAHDLLALLASRGEAVPDYDAVRSAWTRAVAAQGMSESTHELVELAGRPSFLSPFSFSDFKRRGSWSTESRWIVWRARNAGYESDLGHQNYDVWLGGEGDVWWGGMPETLGFGKGEGPKTRHFVVSRGQDLRLRRGDAPYQTFHTVPDGVPVNLVTPEPKKFAHVVEVALRRDE